MNAYDFSPLFRYGVGFDRMKSALEGAARAGHEAYPAYNILRSGEDSYRITLVAPGFAPEDLQVEARENVLVVEATPPKSDEAQTYLHQGFTLQGFKQTFQLADYVTVESARFDNGLLHVDLRREVPEALKPRKIEVETMSTAAPSLAHREAA